MEIIIPRSKTDQGGDGLICAIPYGDTLPCYRNENVVRKCKHSSRSCLLSDDKSWKHNTICHQGTSHNIILKNIAKACNLPNAEHYSSHSLRRGFATTARQQGAITCFYYVTRLMATYGNCVRLHGRR